jgi:hypothetical protein
MLNSFAQSPWPRLRNAQGGWSHRPRNTGNSDPGPTVQTVWVHLLDIRGKEQVAPGQKSFSWRAGFAGRRSGLAGAELQWIDENAGDHDKC